MDHAQMLRSVSRTFALSIEQLPAMLREAVTVAYLLLRVADCLEDHPHMDRAEKAALLRRWAAVLRGQESAAELTASLAKLDGGDPEVFVAQQAERLLARMHELPSAAQAAIVARVAKTADGMARWQVHGPFVDDEAALDDYMHEVAGRVGYLLTDLFALHSPRIRARREQLMPLGREYGLALQTVNVIRGLRTDYERGWVYVPATFYRRAGLTRDGLFEPANLDTALEVVGMLADKAARHLQNGVEYVQAFPRRQHQIRLACMWPLLFAVRTLAISRDNTDVLLSEAKMGRDQVRAIVRQTRLFGWSNSWLEGYYAKLAIPPRHELPSSTSAAPALPQAG